jgi:glycosyltransferase involved in cell wall biosynthesis
MGTGYRTIAGGPGQPWAVDRFDAARHQGADAVLPTRAEARCVAIVAPSGATLAATAGSVIQEISGRGHSVYCFAPAFDRASEAILHRMQARLGDLPSFRQGLAPIADQRTVMRLISAFKDLKPSAVVGYSAKAATLAGLAARLAGVPRIVAMIDELGRGFAEAPERASVTSRRFQKSLLRLAFRLCDTGIFLNEENHKLLQRHKVVPARLRQFPLNGSGVDLRLFPVTPLGPLDRGVIFLYAAPLDVRLGVEDYCEAARALRAKSGHFKCLILGPEVRGPNGFPLAELKRYRDVVQYLGPQADPRPYMARAHAIVLPARGDAIPKPLIEAIAMGRPVITSTARGCRAAVREGGNGMLVPAGDPMALALAMARLLLRPDLIPSMSRASRELAESQFDCRRINALLLDALDLV